MSTHSLTSALDRGGWLTPCLPLLVVYEAGWAPGPVWTGAESLPPLHRDSIPGLSTPQRISMPTELSQPTIVCGTGYKICVLQNNIDVSGRTISSVGLHTCTKCGMTFLLVGYVWESGNCGV